MEPPIHPGEHLAECLDELCISQYRLAKATGVPPRRINEIIHRPPRHHRRYRDPARRRPPDVPGLLAEPAAPPRPRPRARRHHTPAHRPPRARALKHPTSQPHPPTRERRGGRGG